MSSFADAMNLYKAQLDEGDIQTAYRGLLAYLRSLKTQLKQRHPDFYLSGDIYLGQMDLSFFSFTPDSLKRKKLKVSIVFLHEAFKFEIWLGAVNKKIQLAYWKQLKKSDWHKYHLVPEGVNSILKYVIVDKPDFSDLANLTNQIEEQSLEFIHDVEQVLSEAIEEV